MGAGTSAAGTGADGAARARSRQSEGKPETVDTPVAPATEPAPAAESAAESGREPEPESKQTSAAEPESAGAGDAAPSGPEDSADSAATTAAADSATAGSDAPEPPEPGSRFSLTQDTARPEGGGRAAPRDAPAPARQWPLLSVLGTIGLGLLIVGLHPFAEAFRIGTILIGIALIGGAALRRVMPSVGMLAVRSRFTDMLTYGLLGVAIVMLSLMTQPRPWLEIPFLEDIVHSTVP
ncbi:DUF3017 domain-containing protein [Streptomyces sp. NBC_01429]|uniref:DUF3017 domain-containing protein n=1 Tax=Streptomyces sp. NBC_01429 TaxID=2903862 RepID=UPI002E2C6051|nr:DUF3017 domain-containing protein [Streptomyces sp. NBC_01429]